MAKEKYKFRIKLAEDAFPARDTGIKYYEESDNHENHYKVDFKNKVAWFNSVTKLESFSFLYGDNRLCVKLKFIKTDEIITDLQNWLDTVVSVGNYGFAHTNTFQINGANEYYFVADLVFKNKEHAAFCKLMWGGI
jgi:hypothetical protein